MIHLQKKSAAVSSAPATAFEGIAERLAPEMRKRFLWAVMRARHVVPDDELQELVAARNPAGLERAITLKRLDDALYDALQVVQDAYVQGGYYAMASVVSKGPIGADFNLNSWRAVRWVNKNGARLVTQINTQTRKALRGIVVRALESGQGPADAAREIKSLIGLTDRDAAAVQRLRAGLQTAGVKPDTVAKRTATYANRLLHHRASVIARTELLSATSAAQTEAWEQAVDAGIVDTDTTVRKWVATKGERTCNVCQPMWGERTPIGLPWILKSTGREVMFPQEAHPQCRCTQVLVYGVKKADVVVLKDWCRGAGGANRCGVVTAARANHKQLSANSAKLIKDNPQALNHKAVAEIVGPDSNFNEVSAVLRGQATWMSPREQADIHKTVAAIDAAFDKPAATIKKPLTVFRGVNFKTALKPGMTLQDQSYPQATTDINHAASFTKGKKYVLQIDLKPGQRVIVPKFAGTYNDDMDRVYKPSFEAQVVLPRGTKMRVVSVEKPGFGGTRVVRVEVVE